MSVAFPLSAIVGQEQLVQALLINAVAPDVGGVLVRGQRGTAKSTAVRGLAPLLPHVTVAQGQTYAFAPGEVAPSGAVAADSPVHERPAPLVELPLGATLDRLVGALDLGRALEGQAAFEPGLLARAHRGILYVDEVNLLPDHLVDALLDAAASGVAHVEREAVSIEHTARFLLVGTMNVEEGELRPQLLDRFGLGVEVQTPSDPHGRAEIVRRRLAFECDPRAFVERWREQEQELAARITQARDRLQSVRLPERELLRITGACARLGVDGVRGDIVCARAARALAALEGVEEVAEEHVLRAARYALAHRRQRWPIEDRSLDHSPPDEQELEQAFAQEPSEDGRRDGAPRDDWPPDGPPQGSPDGPPDDGSPSGGPPYGNGGSGQPAPPREGSSGGRRQSSSAAPSGSSAPAGESRPMPLAARVPRAALTLAGSGGGPAGRRGRKSSGPGAGAIDSRPAAARGDDIAVVATLQAHLAGAPVGHVREHIRAGREGALLCLLLDASGSMGARRRLARVKGALIELLREAYARRDRVAVVCFRDSRAQVLVAPGTPLERAAEAIRSLPTGGRTPLAAGLDRAAELLAAERRRERERRAIAIVFTDGRVSDRDGAVRRAGIRLARLADAMRVIDTEDGPVRLGLAATLAAAAGADLHSLAQATTDSRRAA